MYFNTHIDIEEQGHNRYTIRVYDQHLYGCVIITPKEVENNDVIHLATMLRLKFSRLEMTLLEERKRNEANPS